MKIEWWRTAAQHMWRTYFAVESRMDESGYPDKGGADISIYNMCAKVLHDKFSTADQDIIRMYFTSKWGQDIHDVEDYSLKHNLTVNYIWNTIRRANRAVFVELGLIDRKEENNEQPVV